ncbi:25057_t:CDS:2 [Cetraspora pellucida]|uniref:25057_t:CDS:1 n=1 Tax=Cetraspora pellucida TaxID=1433469 RepID=A0A9N9BYI3_9GLOM|nr:25057_t:CDS:2 [Cetraspora pellucida]
MKSFLPIFVYFLGIEAAFAVTNTCNVSAPFIPDSTQQRTSPEALDFFYLCWKISYSAGESLPMNIIVNPNNKTPPSQVSLSLYDEFNNIKLIDIANAPLTSYEIATPFPVYTWTVVSEIKSSFDFTSGYFTMVMSYNDGDNIVKKDRRLKLLNVVASPGGTQNPAFTNNTTQQTT